MLKLLLPLSPVSLLTYLVSRKRVTGTCTRFKYKWTFNKSKQYINMFLFTFQDMDYLSFHFIIYVICRLTDKKAKALYIRDLFIIVHSSNVTRSIFYRGGKKTIQKYMHITNLEIKASYLNVSMSKNTFARQCHQQVGLVLVAVTLNIPHQSTCRIKFWRNRIKQCAEQSKEEESAIQNLTE